MSRDLKFSAYDIYNDEWEYYSGPLELYNMFFGIHDGQLRWPRQYVGMEDKNGQEVYEGSIVRQEERNFVVEFYKGSFILDPIKGSGWLVLHTIMLAEDDPNIEREGLEVVGNKWEDEHLLDNG